MFCPNCGMKMDDGAVFCGGCGYSRAPENKAFAETEVSPNPAPEVQKVQETQHAPNNQNQPVKKAPEQKAAPSKAQAQNQPEKNAPQQKAASKAQAQNQPVKNTPAKKQKPPKQKKKKKKGVIVVILLMLMAIALVVVGAVGLLVGSFFFTPEAVAKDFGSKLAAQDISGMYDMMFEEDGFVSYEQFEEKYTNDQDFLADYAGYSDFTVYELGETAFEIEFSGDRVLYVEVIKSNDGFLYFDDYQIKVAACVGYDLYIPDGAKASVNGVEVTVEGTYDPVTCLYNYYIYPILTGDNEIVVTDVNGNVYEKRVEAYDTSYFNTLTLDAEDLKKGNVIKDNYTAEDAEAFFNDIMNEYIFKAYTAVYSDTPEKILSMGVESLIVNDYRLYTNGYTAGLVGVTDNAREGVLVSDIMTEEEYNSLPYNENGWAVYKISEIQKRIDNLWGAGVVDASGFKFEDDIITSKGFLLRNKGDSLDGIYDYYGKVKSSKYDATKEQVVIDAYVLKCDTVNKKIYDEATGLQVTTAQIKRGAGVDFDAIVKQLGIDTAGLSTVQFTFRITDKGVILMSAYCMDVSEDILQAQNAVLQKYSHSFYMKVNAVGGLNMRYEPTEKSQILKLIPDASAVEVRGYSSNIKDWVYVCWGGYEGWVSYAYLTPAEYTSQPDGSVYWYTVDAEGGLNMRVSDDQTSKLVKLIPEYSYVKFICYNADATWAYVVYNDTYSGWVNTDYIKFAY